MGKEGCLAISYSLHVNSCLVQFLKLRSVTMCNEDVELLADSLQDYLYLLSLDLSHNRLEGARAGIAIAKILSRKCLVRGGRDLSDLNLSYNKI